MSDLTKSLIFKPIGFLKSCYPDKFGAPRQSGLVNNTISELEILPEWQPELGLQGLEGYSHIWVTFVFHLNTNKKYRAKIHPPRLGGESIGVFATRSPHRPNPIGLSLCQIIKIENKKIYLDGVDLVDGTPVLDIKPYLPQFESKPEAKGGWATSDEHAVREIQVRWTERALTDLAGWQHESGPEQLRSAIESVLKQDPRPVIYRGFEGADIAPYRNEHAFRLYNGDIKFQFVSEALVEVVRIDF